MNIFKVGRGDFFGILIPGAFLLINILLFYYNAFDAIPEWLNFNTNPSKPILPTAIINTILIPGLIVFSYILGFFLRSISPHWAERLSLIIWCPLCFFQGLFFYIFSGKQDKMVSSFSEIFKQMVKRKLEPFPYIDWFYRDYLLKSPLSYRRFY